MPQSGLVDRPETATSISRNQPGTRRFLRSGVRVTIAVLLLTFTGSLAAQLNLPGLSPESAHQNEPADNSEASTAENPKLIEARKQLTEVKARIDHLSEIIAGADERMDELRRRLGSGEDLAGLESIDLEVLTSTELDNLVNNQRMLIEGHQKRILDLNNQLNALLKETAQADPGKTVSKIRAKQPKSGKGQTIEDSEQRNGSVVDEQPEYMSDTLTDVNEKLAQREAELSSLLLSNSEKLNTLATLERDFEQRMLEQRQDFLERASQRLRNLREAQVKQSIDSARETRRERVFEPQVVRKLDDQIVQAEEYLAKALTQSGDIAEKLQDMRSRLGKIRDDFTTTKTRVEVVGASPAVGRLLRRRLDELPSNTGYKRDAKERHEKINKAIDLQIDIDEALRDGGDVQTEVQKLIDPIQNTLDAKSIATLRDTLTETVTKARQIVTELHGQYGAIAARLTELDQAEKQLIIQSREYVTFIESELMTIPSGPVLHRIPLDDWTQAISGLFDPDRWKSLAVDIWNALISYQMFVFVTIILSVLAFASRPRARLKIARMGNLTRKIRTDSMSLTFATMFDTLLLASAPALLLGGFGWIIRQASISDLSTSVGGALLRASMLVLFLGYTVYMVRPNGLATRHFKWTEDTCRHFASNLRWFVPTIVITVALNRFMFYSGVSDFILFSRILILLSVLLVTVFLWRVGSRAGNRDVTNDEVTQMSDPLAAHHRSFWLYVLIGLISIVAVMSYFGYHYTAMRLDTYIGWTILLLIALMQLNSLLLRWSALVQRRLRFNEIVKRREEARAARTADSDAPIESTDSKAADENDLDVVRLGDQTRRLITAMLVSLCVAGLYLIWRDLFPALSFLDEIKMPFSRVVIEEGVENQIPVSLVEFLFGILVFIATIIGARNLPGLLEFVVLQRLPIDAGVRYATITIARYLIVAIGIVIGFSIIGADWSKLQWLIAALGVGLGFGLQEIVANFVSGIILLFERPIRVGDIITLGDTDGVVTRIRIRATTIRNWDQRELVVPNKEFITGRLLNWTLSDPINRMVILVGIAYGSDVDKALKILLETAARQPAVLDEPRPVVVFEGFGESSLDLSLRCYMSGLDSRLVTQTTINLEINQRFAEAGIEIPFAQRDIHLRGGEPLEIVMRKPGDVNE
ncbi:MAG: potassium transporter [marine bacterium B5-7]|nr:MAG: potassium transporter [marine bacterium B5-7]